jgi:Mu transposase-like protein
VRPVSNAQVRKLMEEMSKHGEIGRAAMKAGMDRKTARKYVAAGTLPSAMVKPRDWQTRPDPFEEHWPEIEARLRQTPELEAKTVFAWLQDQHPGKYNDGQLRTLQRHVKRWRAAHGPEREIVLRQQHRAGEAAQTDFTHATELAVTIVGQVFVHLLCVFVLPYSNWEWATICVSESMAALRKGVQRAVFRLGRVPRYHQTDGSTAATHHIPAGQAGYVEGGKRPFNVEYLALMQHLGMTPRTIAIGAKEQNGDVESANGALKRRLEQQLLLRGSREFESVDAYQAFIDEVVSKVNLTRQRRVEEELAAMRELSVAKLPEYVEEDVHVSEWSTVRIKHCAYSVPSRLKGEWVRVRVYEDKLEVYYAGELQLACERLLGRNQHRIDYRHVIWSLMRKPGGFARYVYREEMFPQPVFRAAYDAIQRVQPGTKGDVTYLRILHLAASTLETDVAAALRQLAAAGTPITVDAVKALVAPSSSEVAVPSLTAPPVDLTEYDVLLDAQEAA